MSRPPLVELEDSSDEDEEEEFYSWEQGLRPGRPRSAASSDLLPQRSRSPSVEFEPEDYSWLSQVLLQPLGSLQLPSIPPDEQLLLQPLASAIYQEVPGFVKEYMQSSDCTPSHLPATPLDDQMEVMASLHLALDGALTFSDGGDAARAVSDAGEPAVLPETDFIAAAEEMKKIFQVPYHDQELSILVHRVGGSLHLGGDFDVSWLMEPDQDGKVPQWPSGKRRTRSAGRRERQQQAAQQPEPPGPFMCYSVAKGNASCSDGAEGSSRPAEEGADDEEDTVLQGAELREFRASLKRIKASERKEDIKHVFHWKFNDIGMLLGSDSIIMGGPGDRDSVRMCMRDIEEHISSAACLDLWLDNLLSGANELALCYHKEGVMQGYQLLKTGDIPSITHCQHLATACHDSAAQILSLMKEKCTVDGASYLVQKAPGRQEVQVHLLKMADGAAAQESQQQAPGQSGSTAPFSSPAPGRPTRDGATHQPNSFPMAMLCYRMAMRLLRASSGLAAIQHAQRLLFHCISLVDKSRHPRLWASAQMHLATVVVQIERMTVQEGRHQDKDPSQAGSSGPLMRRQTSQEESTKVPANILYLVLASEYLGMGINCLTYYEPEAGSLIGRMYVQAANTLTTLAEECSLGNLPGFAFRAIRFAVCNMEQAIGISAKDASSGWERQLTRRLLSSSGHAYHCLAALQSQLLQDPARVNQVLYYHIQHLNGLMPDSLVAHNGEDTAAVSGSFPVAKTISLDREMNLTYAVQRFLGALKLFKDQDNADGEYDEGVKALAAVYTELGDILKDSGRFTKAYQHYRQGIQLFQSVGADLCVANSHMELARLAAAQAKAVDPSMNSLGELQRLTSRCIDSYKSAIDLLGAKRSHSELWIKTKIELGDVLVSSGGYLQAVLALSKDPQELGNIAVGMYRDAIKSYTDVTAALVASKESDGDDPDGKSQSLLPGRMHSTGRMHSNMTVDNITWVANATASTQHQAARLHGQLARLAVTAANVPAATKEARRARLLSLALGLVDKAQVVFNMDDNPVRYLRLQLDAAALLRQLLPPRGVVKVLETALWRLINCVEVFDPARFCNCAEGTCACGSIAAEAAATEFSISQDSSCSTCPASVWRELEVEINLVLRELIQARTAAPGPGKTSKERIEALKSMYRTSLTQREHCTPEQMLRLLLDQCAASTARGA